MDTHSGEGVEAGVRGGVCGGGGGMGAGGGEQLCQLMKWDRRESPFRGTPIKEWPGVQKIVSLEKGGKSTMYSIPLNR